ncbi:hypothetical protein NOV72_02618 [Caballeronia novacaledonica]|uniref:Uncharacterized protein n=1 Tax=Caballeronia novacaledonica TaxID=1544861 RepID=A0A2U3I5G5_9BURK|nr:hypothetical protein [Caballeronia novacaledonica]SPB15392.1 hypothetical protein NOV72_02618 [Caballeronia novacaledonica]
MNDNSETKAGILDNGPLWLVVFEVVAAAMCLDGGKTGYGAIAQVFFALTILVVVSFCGLLWSMYALFKARKQRQSPYMAYSAIAIHGLIVGPILLTLATL